MEERFLSIVESFEEGKCSEKLKHIIDTTLEEYPCFRCTNPTSGPRRLSNQARKRNHTKPRDKAIRPSFFRRTSIDSSSAQALSYLKKIAPNNFDSLLDKFLSVFHVDITEEIISKIFVLCIDQGPYLDIYMKVLDSIQMIPESELACKKLMEEFVEDFITEKSYLVVSENNSTDYEQFCEDTKAKQSLYSHISLVCHLLGQDYLKSKQVRLLVDVEEQVRLMMQNPCSIENLETILFMWKTLVSKKVVHRENMKFFEYEFCKDAKFLDSIPKKTLFLMKDVQDAIAKNEPKKKHINPKYLKHTHKKHEHENDRVPPFHGKTDARPKRTFQSARIPNSIPESCPS